MPVTNGPTKKTRMRPSESAPSTLFILTVGLMPNTLISQMLTRHAIPITCESPMSVAPVEIVHVEPEKNSPWISAPTVSANTALANAHAAQ